MKNLKDLTHKEVIRINTQEEYDFFLSLFCMLSKKLLVEGFKEPEKGDIFTIGYATKNKSHFTDGVLFLKEEKYDHLKIYNPDEIITD
jgi:hypothetical protein